MKMRTQLDQLESVSIQILREAYATVPDLAMLWSIGKDSTVMLWLARKAFYGHVPFPLIHVDTHFKIPQMIAYRDQLVREWRLNMIVGCNEEAILQKKTFQDGGATRIECCRLLKTQALLQTIQGTAPRYRYNHDVDSYCKDTDLRPFQGIIAGVRADEEGSRSKERYFSPRNLESQWEIADQPPEFWNQFNTDYPPKTHIRIHPLLDWTELNIWEYIEQEKIPTVSLYYSKEGQRYRSLGCWPCTTPILSQAKNPAEIIAELTSGSLKNIAERSGRAQDQDDGGGLETLRKDGYM